MRNSSNARRIGIEPGDDHPQSIARLAAVAAAAGLVALAGAALAAGDNQREAQARYKSERAACMNGTFNQDRATCLQEAGAALGEARRGNLANGGAREKFVNRTDRCNPLPAADREDCLSRMRGEGAATGSSQSGGIYRETTTTTITRPLAR